jgi:DNA-directed RNA polymerase subunit omega
MCPPRVDWTGKNRNGIEFTRKELRIKALYIKHKNCYKVKFISRGCFPWLRPRTSLRNIKQKPAGKKVEEIIMARITVEDCLQKVNNRFALIHAAAKRVRQIRKGSEPTILSKNKDIVVALREIASGRVFVPQGLEEALLLPAGKLLSEGEAEKTEEKSNSEVD